MSEPLIPPTFRSSKEGVRASILIVDDDEAVLRALQRVLRAEPFEITLCNEPRAALDLARRGTFAVVVSDHQMPGMSGTDLLSSIKEHAPDTMRILLTGHPDVETTMRAINDGEIHRFITKPWNATELLQVLRDAVERHRLQQANRHLAEDLERTAELLRQRNQELEELAAHDALTGLYNRREFELQLERQIKIFQRDGRSFCLALGDIDDFKRVNDTYGHPAGDQVLKAIAALMMSAHRAELDSAFRHGGEEFAMLLRNSTLDTGGSAIERLLGRIRALRVPTSSGALSVTMSFGLGQYRPSGSAMDWVQKVDAALYQAKQSGKNRVCLLQDVDR